MSGCLGSLLGQWLMLRDPHGGRCIVLIDEVVLERAGVILENTQEAELNLTRVEGTIRKAHLLTKCHNLTCGTKGHKYLGETKLLSPGQLER
jgi:hypothetical protein